MTPTKTLHSSGRRVHRLLEQVQQVFVGKEEVVKLTVVTLLARGHLLIEDVPGIGKTLLGIALARSVEASFRRIQFTSDLLPSDILGVSVLNQTDRVFEFRPGPVFSHILLADEINRSTPKTQSALLEAMSELQVTVDGTTRPLPDPFLVLATQNPVEYHGSYPLPEAQLDRFLLRVRIGYPAPEDEKRILQGVDPAERVKTLDPILSLPDVRALQAEAAAVRVSDALLDYAVALAEASRRHPGVKLGLSPRGAIALCRAARSLALIEGRDYCIPDDFKTIAVPVIAHRLLLDTSLLGVARIAESEGIVETLLKGVPAPG
ncbi:MAG: MoxR family ATPase [Elusimicrobia bacterium]|nr:MoxR family ATPase [Elusimicrobiota bacterium]